MANALRFSNKNAFISPLLLKFKAVTAIKRPKSTKKLKMFIIIGSGLNKLAKKHHAITNSWG